LFYKPGDPYFLFTNDGVNKMFITPEAKKERVLANAFERSRPERPAHLQQSKARPQLEKASFGLRIK
jgi:hypothetical protein